MNLVGYEFFGLGSTKSGISAVYKLIKNDVNLWFEFKDGSGLSRKNAVSASHFCQLLKAIYGTRMYEDFKGSLSVAGEKGTLKMYAENK